MSKENIFLVTTIVTFDNGEVFLPTPNYYYCIEDAKIHEEMIFNTVDKEIVKQVDVYIDVLPTLKRESHNSWRR